MGNAEAGVEWHHHPVVVLKPNLLMGSGNVVCLFKQMTEKRKNFKRALDGTITVDLLMRSSNLVCRGRVGCYVLGHVMMKFIYHYKKTHFYGFSRR